MLIPSVIRILITQICLWIFSCRTTKRHEHTELVAIVEECIINKIQVGVRFSNSPMFRCVEIYGFLSGCLKIRFCGILFTLTLEGVLVIRHICIYLHMQTFASIIWKEMFMLAVCSAGSRLWKLVAGKPDEGSDLWPSTPDRVTSSSSEVWLLLINTLPFDCLITSIWWAFTLNQATPWVQALSQVSAFSHSFPQSQTEPKTAWHYKDKNYR